MIGWSLFVLAGLVLALLAGFGIGYRHGRARERDEWTSPAGRARNLEALRDLPPAVRGPRRPPVPPRGRTVR